MEWYVAINFLLNAVLAIIVLWWVYKDDKKVDKNIKKKHRKDN